MMMRWRLSVKVGDLVQLSGYGATRGFNSQLTMVDTRQTGLVIKIEKGSYPYIIKWSKTPPGPYAFPDWCHHRRELKYAGR